MQHRRLPLNPMLRGLLLLGATAGLGLPAQALGSSGHDYRFAPAVPGPGTAGLWLLGLAALPALRRRRTAPEG